MHSPWEKTIKKLVCLHIIVAFALFIWVQHEKEAAGKFKDYLMASFVLLCIASVVTLLCFLRCLAMAIGGSGESSRMYDAI